MKVIDEKPVGAPPSARLASSQDHPKHEGDEWRGVVLPCAFLNSQVISAWCSKIRLSTGMPANRGFQFARIRSCHSWRAAPCVSHGFPPLLLRRHADIVPPRRSGPTSEYGASPTDPLSPWAFRCRTGRKQPAFFTFCTSRGVVMTREWCECD